MLSNLNQKKVAQEILLQIRDLLLWQIFACIFFYKIIFTREVTFLGFPDASIQSFAWFAKLSSAWRNFELPLWDFAINSGTSFIGELQTAPFYPLNIIFALIAPPADQFSLDLYIVFHYGLAAYFMFVFLKGNNLNKPASILGAIIFAFVGTIAQKACGQPNIFFGMAYLPIILFSYQKGLEVDKPFWQNPWLYLCGIMLAFSLLAGHAQPFIHAFVGLCFLLVFTLRFGDNSIRRRLIKLGFAALVAVCFAAIQIVSTIEYLAKALRWVGAENPISGLRRTPFEVYATHEILHPNQLIGFFTPLFDIKDGASLFITLTGLGLLIIGCFAKHRIKWFAVVLAIFAVLFSLGNYTFIGRWSWYIPIISSVREPVRMLFLYHFAVSFLAAVGVQFLVEFIFKKIKLNDKFQLILYALVIGLICYEVYSIQNRLFSTNGNELSPKVFYAKNDAVQFLENRLKTENNLFRVINNKDALPKNIGYVYDIFTTQGHRATMQKKYFEYLSRDWSLNSIGYDNLGAKYIVSKTPLTDFKQIFQKENFYIYERPNALPIFRVVNSQGNKIDGISNVKWATNSVEFEIKNDLPGELVFAQPYYSGWRVYIDGEQRLIEIRDELNAVKLNGNEHQVRFVYSPFYLWFCFVSLLLVLGGTIYSLRNIDRYKNENK